MPVRKIFLQGHSRAPSSNSLFKPPVPEGVFIATQRMCGRNAHNVPINTQNRIRELSFDGLTPHQIHEKLTTQQFQVYSQYSPIWNARVRSIPDMTISFRQSNKRPQGVFNINKYNLTDNILGLRPPNNGTGWGHIRLLNYHVPPGVLTNDYNLKLETIVNNIIKHFPNTYIVIFVNACQSAEGGIQASISNFVRSNGSRHLKLYKNNVENYIHNLYVNNNHRIVDENGIIVNNAGLRLKFGIFISNNGLSQVRQMVARRSLQKSEQNYARASRINWNRIKNAPKTNNLYAQMSKEIRNNKWSDQKIRRIVSPNFLGRPKFVEFERYLRNSAAQNNYNLLEKITRLLLA
jgi:hypothetical protein